MKEPTNIHGLLSEDGKKVNKSFHICYEGKWQCFDTTPSNIKQILDGTHPFFRRKCLSNDEKEYLNRGLSLLNNNERAASEERTESEEALVQ